MHVVCFSSWEELLPYAEAWDRLAGDVPFRSWAWNAAWWRHYGEDSAGRPARCRLFVLAVFDQDALIGVAPWHIRSGGPRGRVLRWLDCREICGDYLGLLCLPAREEQVVEALADCLAGATHEVAGRPRWDLMELTGVDAADRPVQRLANCLAARGFHVHTRPGPNCWRLTLPATWDEYLQQLSKYHRRDVRKLARGVLDAGKAVLHTVASAEELPRAFAILADLHQRRRAALGEEGRFGAPRFAAFHREVTQRLLAAGQLQLHWLEMDGAPVAAEYVLSAGGILYDYQAGIDPARLAYEPGRLMTAALVRRAIAQGYRAVDFLRGDEPYKAHYRAEPRPQRELRIVPPRAAAQWRHNLWLAGSSVKAWLQDPWPVAPVKH